MSESSRLAYGLDECSKMLGVTRRHLADLVREGKLESFKLGRRVLIPAHVVEKLVGL